MKFLANLLFWSVCCLSGLVCASGLAHAEFIVPDLTGPVVDGGDLISARDERFLRELILRFQAQTKAQIQVLTVKTLGGVPVEQASIQTMDQWKIGDKKRDDGVLLFVAADERKIRIEVGQGLEGTIPDIKAKRIIEDVMVPVFRQSSPSQGILVGAYQIMKTIDPSFEANESQSGSFQTDQRSIFDRYEGLFFLIFVIFILLVNLFGPRGRGPRGGFWLGGGLGGWGSGGGWSGGSSSGGWSGGGGGFSGGGASGNW